MSSVQEPALGRFCWIEVNVVDAKAGKDFYSKLFSWETEDCPMGEGSVYSVFKKGGKATAGLFLLNPELLQQGVPPHWFSYIGVANIDESAIKAKELGGVVIKGPFDIPAAGRMAVIQDPAGAHFALWQSLNPADPLLRGEANSLCWNELQVKDLRKAGAFYTQLLGWEVVEDLSTGKPYSLFQQNGEIFAGMMEIEASWGEVPPNWMVYFSVEDIEVMSARIQSLSGKTETPIMDIPKVGRLLVAADPQGAVFALLQSSGM
jgi:predicted enzyme related to lactoylglutathione lyase